LQEIAAPGAEFSGIGALIAALGTEHKIPPLLKNIVTLTPETVNGR
jgi:hypothetical protein